MNKKRVKNMAFVRTKIEMVQNYSTQNKQNTKVQIYYLNKTK